MLLIDGVKYKEWTDLKETEDLEPMVIKRAKDIFGEQSEYFDIKRQLESCLGRRTIPDGYVVDFGKPAQWHIVEVELSCHPVDKHIREQVNDFITAMEKVVSHNRHKIIDEIFAKIDGNQSLRLKVEELIGSKEIHKFLTDLILYKPPILTIIIERQSGTLREELDASLRYSPMNIVELRTFRREGAEAVHAHLFEPQFQPTGSLGNQKIISGKEREQPSFDLPKRGLKLYIKDGKHYNPMEALVAVGATLSKMVEGRGDRRATMPDGTTLEYVGSTKHGKSKIAKVHAYLLDHGFTFSNVD